MGQTATDKLISPIVGKTITLEYDLDARLDALEASVPASEVTYTPAVGGNWVNPDPTLVSGALDDLAGRVTTLEAGVPASEVTYTPADTNDWPGADPTLVSGALDLVADRVATAEGTLLGLANAAADIVTLFAADVTLAAAQRTPTITIAAEAAEAIDVSITQVDGLGNAVAVADRILIELFADALFTTATNAAAFPITDNGAGSVVATDAGVVKVLFNTSAAGALEFRITDTATGSANTLYGRGTYLGASGVRIAAAPFYFQVTFTA